MAPAGNNAKRLSSVNHTTKTIIIMFSEVLYLDQAVWNTNYKSYVSQFYKTSHFDKIYLKLCVLEDLDADWTTAYKTELFPSPFSYQLYGQNLLLVAKVFCWFSLECYLLILIYYQTLYSTANYNMQLVFVRCSWSIF